MSGVFGFLRLDTAPVAEPALDPVPFREPGTGCLIVAEFPSLAAATEWAEADPYVAAGVYAGVSVKPFKKSFPA